LVKKIIDDSIAAENQGLKGSAYFDARWSQAGEEAVSGYRFYDKSIHTAAGLVKESGVVPVVLDTQETLFQRGDCPSAGADCPGKRALVHSRIGELQ